MCDVIAVGALLYPELILASSTLYGRVELSGSHTRGATVFDWYDNMLKDHAKNIHVVTKFDILGMDTQMRIFNSPRLPRSVTENIITNLNHRKRKDTLRDTLPLKLLAILFQ